MFAARVQAQVLEVAVGTKEVANLIGFAIGGLRILRGFPGNAIRDRQGVVFRFQAPK